MDVAALRALKARRDADEIDEQTYVAEKAKLLGLAPEAAAPAPPNAEGPAPAPAWPPPKRPEEVGPRRTWKATADDKVFWLRALYPGAHGPAKSDAAVRVPEVFFPNGGFETTDYRLPPKPRAFCPHRFLVEDWENLAPDLREEVEALPWFAAWAAGREQYESKNASWRGEAKTRAARLVELEHARRCPGGCGLAWCAKAKGDLAAAEAGRPGKTRAVDRDLLAHARENDCPETACRVCGAARLARKLDEAGFARRAGEPTSRPPAATRLRGVRASRPFVSAESSAAAAPPRLRETFEDPPRRPAPREFGRGATRPAAAQRAGRHAAAPRRVVARDRRALREVPSGVDRAAAAARRRRHGLGARRHPRGSAGARGVDRKRRRGVAPSVRRRARAAGDAAAAAV